MMDMDDSKVDRTKMAGGMWNETKIPEEEMGLGRTR